MFVMVIVVICYGHCCDLLWSLFVMVIVTVIVCGLYGHCDGHRCGLYGDCYGH